MTSAATPPEQAHVARRRPRRRAVLIGVSVFLLLLVGAGAWVGFKAVSVRDSLLEAQSVVREIKNTAATDPAAVDGLTGRLTLATAQARSDADDPLWRAAELVPVIGTNLSAVRRLAEVIDDVAVDAVQPLASLAGSLGPEVLKPVNGRIDIGAVAAAADEVAAADDALASAKSEISAIPTEGTVGQVRDAHSQLAALVADASTVTSGMRAVTQVAPAMLGSTGPRNYLLIVQNNAEVRALGGNPAALVLLNVTDGVVSIAAQASSLDFPQDPSLIPDLAVYDAYYPHSPTFIMDITTRPDFPTAGLLAQAFWQKYRGQPVDGVISFDPVALGYLLDATGPLVLPTGETLSRENAASFLMSDVYRLYPVDAQDAFFASAASGVFDALTAGDFEPGRLLVALEKASMEHRFLLWSSRPDEQAVIETTPIGGVLPKANDDTTAIGVYAMDRSVSKMSYYLDASAEVVSRSCGADGPLFTVRATFSSTLDPADAASLPSYVAAGFLPRGESTTDVYFVGPVGAEVATLDGSAVPISRGADLGRPVVGFNALLGPLQTRTFEVTFRGAPGGTYGPAELFMSPLVRPSATTVTVSPDC